MPEESNKSFWTTIPGILTALGGIITAVTGLIIALHPGSPSKPNEDKMNSTASDARSMDNQKREEQSSSEPVKEVQQNSSNENTLAAAERTNLLSSENGGQIISASSEEWNKAIDGDDKNWGFFTTYRDPPEAVFGFKEDRSAILNMFKILITETRDENVKEFELFVSDSPSGPFHTIGKFSTQNMKLFKTPYQEFKFNPVKAKYLKVKLNSPCGSGAAIYLREIQLFGKLE